MATENRAWGYLRIQVALSNLGHELARGTIANILKRNGMSLHWSAFGIQRVRSF